MGGKPTTKPRPLSPSQAAALADLKKGELKKERHSWALRGAVHGLGRALLGAWAGERFALSNEPIWVRDVAVAVAADQGAPA